MRKPGVTLAVALTVSATSVAQEVSTTASDRAAALWRPIAAGVRKELEASGVVGGSFWFLRGEDVVAREIHGFADLASKRRVDENTVFHWASITKTFTGIVTMQLRDRGRLKLADRVVDRLPELGKVHGGDWDVKTVTLRHLLSHSSGFRGNTWPWGGQAWQPYEPESWEQLAAMFPYTRLQFAPGSKFSYSNPGIVFVGRILEQITGEDFEVHVDKNVLKPLGMHRSFFDDTPYHLLAHRSNNYSLVDGKHRANGLDLDTGITVSNGGLNAPIPDMVRYVQFLLGVGVGGGDAKQNGGVLPRKSLREMWNPEHDAGKAGRSVRSMALTYFVYDLAGARVIGHTGSQKAFQCFFLADPVGKTAVIAAFNSEAIPREPAKQTRAIMLRFMNTVLEELMPPFRARRGGG